MAIEYMISKVTNLCAEPYAKIICQAMSIDTNNIQLTKNGEVYYVCTPYFIIYISETDQDGKEVQKKSYGIKPDIDITVRINSKKEPEASQHLVQLVDYLLRDDTCDLILEFNGEFPVIIRKKGFTMINHQYDDGTDFPFDQLNMPVNIVYLPCQ